MPRKTPTKQQPASAPARRSPTSEGQKTFTIPQFCRRNPMSENTYFTMREMGRGPREIRPTGGPRGVVLISEEAEKDWIAAREKPDAEQVAARAKRAPKMGA
jgi:hypothetical protein